MRRKNLSLSCAQIAERVSTRYTAIILLSFVLAVSFLLVILSCALWANWCVAVLSNTGAYRVRAGR